MHLIGAEDVQSAGRTMMRAAEDMKQAASSMEDVLHRHHQFMDDWLHRLEAILTEKLL